MKKPPITNFKKFEKIPWKHIFDGNYEVLRYTYNTFHFYLKNDQIEGIEIEWKKNPFELEHYSDYILKK